MNVRNRNMGRPEGLSGLWDQVFDHIPNAFWTNKGMSGNCPFCYKESTPGDEKFMICFEGNQFKYYNCYRCGNKGGGMYGINKICRQVGVNISTLEAGELSGFNARGLKPQKEEEGEVEVLDWPPIWIKQTEKIYKDGLSYMEKRGIKNPEQVVKKYEIYFSEVVEIMVGDEKYVKNYPCVVAPMAGSRTEIIGWTTRLMDDKAHPSEPKARALTGSGWKKQSLFGLRELDPRKPVTLVEGVFSSLSTPNSVAAGGKDISDAQIELLASTGASVFIFSLDAGVTKDKFATFMYRLHLEAPGCKVFNIDWEKFGIRDKDPNDLGKDTMEKIIRSVIQERLK